MNKVIFIFTLLTFSSGCGSDTVGSPRSQHPGNEGSDKEKVSDVQIAVGDPHAGENPKVSIGSIIDVHGSFRVPSNMTVAENAVHLRIVAYEDGTQIIANESGAKSQQAGGAVTFEGEIKTAPIQKPGKYVVKAVMHGKEIGECAVEIVPR